MESRDIAPRRLAAQHLTGPGLPDLAAVVAHLGAVQAQEFGHACWNLAQRCATDLDDVAVHAAFDAGTVLRTHALRPTWHFLAPEDIRWVQNRTAPRVKALTAYYERRAGIDDELVARAMRVFEATLRGGKAATRAELSTALAGRGLALSASQVGHLLMRAELDCLLVSGPVRGRASTHMLLDERVPDPGRKLDGDEALAELVRRYFASHGPATVTDFCWWSSLTTAQARTGLALLDDQLAIATIDDVPYHFSPDASAHASGPGGHVLGAYDEYWVAYTKSRAMTNPAGMVPVLPGATAAVNVLVMDGLLVGYWRRTQTRSGIAITVHLGRNLTRAERAALTVAFGRYGTYWGTPIELSWVAPGEIRFAHDADPETLR
jgi:hypothetical protein